MNTLDTVIVRNLPGLQDYTKAWHAMQNLTDKRTEDTFDEIWVLEHLSVFTQGQNGKPEHILNPKNIPIVQSDRGGQVTYHGPGQIVIYVLIDLKRKKYNVRDLVTRLEQTVIEWLATLNIEATAKCDAPGVYVEGKKICSVGLRVRRGCSFHGLALNFKMDLEPFKQINPCGFPTLEMTQVTYLTNVTDINAAKQQLIETLLNKLGYNNPLFNADLF